VRAVRDGDEATLEQAILQMSRSRRMLTPLAFVVGGFTMVFNGLRLLFANWRLTLVQVLPAMWIWLADFDLKEHALHGKSFHALRGPILIPIVLAITAITAASFLLNAVFGFAIVQSHRPQVRPAFAQARSHAALILGSGAVVGVLLGLSTTVVTRWGRPWFGISLSVVIAAMTLCYVAVPSRLIGVKPVASRRDKLTASATGGALGVVVCTPPYLLARLGILMLGSRTIFVPGILVLTIGATLQAAATGAVTAVKMSAKLRVADPSKPSGQETQSSQSTPNHPGKVTSVHPSTSDNRCVFPRRRPLLRGAMVGGLGYAAGRAGARRAAQDQSQDQRLEGLEGQAAPANAPAAAVETTVQQLAKLAQLRDGGVLTNEEFETQKQTILAGGRS
jgi:Short C-terminal domain